MRRSKNGSLNCWVGASLTKILEAALKGGVAPFSLSFGWRRLLHSKDLKQRLFGFSLQLHGHRLSSVDGPCVARLALCLLARDAGYDFAGNQSRDIIAHRRRFYLPPASQRQRSKRHIEGLRSSIFRGRCDRGSKARRYSFAPAS